MLDGLRESKKMAHLARFIGLSLVSFASTNPIEGMDFGNVRLNSHAIL
jgi:hypothetical protein